MVTVVTEEQLAQAESGTSQRSSGGGKGVAKLFPVHSFEDALVVARGIQTHGVDGRLRRIPLLDRIGRKPDSSATRQLITSSSRYGLTTGGYAAEFLTLTEEGARAASSSPATAAGRRLGFTLAIQRIPPFARLYQQLSKSGRIPDREILLDQLDPIGIPVADRARCADVFLANIRYVGLVQMLAGAQRVVTLEQSLENLPNEVAAEADYPGVPAVGSAGPTVGTNPADDIVRRHRIDPAININIQIHIDANASAEQIEQIFSSMGRYILQTEPAE